MASQVFEEAMTRYYAKEGSGYSNKDAQVLGPELLRLQEKYAKQGGLTNQILVDEARDKHSVLHRHFMWSDVTAAELYRRLEAGKLQRSIVLHQRAANGDLLEVPVLKKIPVTVIDAKDKRTTRPNQALQVLVPFARVRDDKAMRREIIRRCRREVASFRRKLAAHQNVLCSPIWDQLFAALERIEQEASGANEALEAV